MDKLGNKLEVGCLVVLNRPRHKELVVGEVLKLTDKKAYIAYFLINDASKMITTIKSKDTIIVIGGKGWSEDE